MRNFSCLVLVACLVLLGCIKSSMKQEIPAGDLYNEISATVSVGGGLDSTHKANGNNTLFAKRIDPNMDTVVIISGGIGLYGTSSMRSIQITLMNISKPGTYPFVTGTGSRQQAFCDYIIGAPFFSTIYEIYSTQSSSQPGSVTIQSITSTNIEGSFTANCSNYVEIRSGTFKGKF